MSGAFFEKKIGSGDLMLVILGYIPKNKTFFQINIHSKDVILRVWKFLYLKAL